MTAETLERGGVRDLLARIQARRLRVRAWFKRNWVPVTLTVMLASALGWFATEHWYHWFEKRVMVVEPGQLVRGAFQRPGPLRRVLERERIKTIVTLSGVGDIPDRFAEQARVVEATGVGWKVVPILGSRPSLEQMSEAADLLADPALRPVFFHCVAGHHRTSLALAAYRMKYEGWTADRAWAEISSLPWSKAETDAFDHEQVGRFAAAYGPKLARREAE